PLPLLHLHSFPTRRSSDLVFPDRTNPAFLMNVAPPRKPQYRAGLSVSFGREKKDLHPFFGEPDLGNAPRFFVLKHATTDGLKIGELYWDVIVLQPMFHKE